MTKIKRKDQSRKTAMHDASVFQKYNISIQIALNLGIITRKEYEDFVFRRMDENKAKEFAKKLQKIDLNNY